jgi:hypothetical protein
MIATHFGAGDVITAVHRIALNDDGSKRGRRIFGVVRRAAVKLDAKADMLAILAGRRRGRYSSAAQ